MKNPIVLLVLLLAWAVTQHAASAQVVGVTAQLDTNTITVGQGTTLRIFAQVLPGYRATSDQIFSWYIDIVNTNGAAAAANYGAMLKPASDKDPLVSSNGFNSGANRLAIFDTFLNLPRAGVTSAVELLRIPITGLAAGQTRFSVRHGSGQPSISEDFIVAPSDGGNFISGGDYSVAFANLTVLPSAVQQAVTCLNIAHAALTGGQRRVTLNFCPASGLDHFVEFRDEVGSGSGWQQAPGGPYNSGVYTETNSVLTRFYRIRAALPGTTLPSFSVAIAPIAAGQVRLSYPVNSNFNYTIETRTSLSSGAWTPLAGAPHNSGNVIVTNPAPQLFFRVATAAK